jgi:D-glycero-D-manno-heptose 1,7-bisphosphate phosphatase
VTAEDQIREHVGGVRKAVFFDRDDLLIRASKCGVKLSKGVDEVELMPNAAKAVAYVKRMGFLAIVVTNQPQVGIGKGTVQGILDIYAKMQALIKAESNTHLDAIYYCPHDPRDGCDCRKPKTGLFKLHGG